MSRCAVKRGFFVLQDCRVPTDEKCSVCGRSCCPQHSRVTLQGKPVTESEIPKGEVPEVACVDCVAKQGSTVEEAGNESTLEDLHTVGWSYGYRRRFYRDSHYSPFYGGRHADHYYDDYDLRGFDGEGVESFTDEDEYSAGFFDS